MDNKKTGAGNDKESWRPVADQCKQDVTATYTKLRHKRTEFHAQLCRISMFGRLLRPVMVAMFLLTLSANLVHADYRELPIIAKLPPAIAIQCIDVWRGYLWGHRRGHF
jgi:hypothetical protein